MIASVTAWTTRPNSEGPFADEFDAWKGKRALARGFGSCAEAQEQHGFIHLPPEAPNKLYASDATHAALHEYLQTTCGILTE